MLNDNNFHPDLFRLHSSGSNCIIKLTRQQRHKDAYTDETFQNSKGEHRWKLPTNTRPVPYAPTETTDLYPESDGKPMADTDLHLYWIKRVQDMIETYFSQSPGVYISGNIMMYDIEGPARTAVSPDILVCFGIGQKFRRTYKVWEEGKPPDFVMEFSSKRTYRNDLDEKMAHYARMVIPEYFLHDPDRRYLPSPIVRISAC